MANVSFKRGLQASIDNLLKEANKSNIVDGQFYLTTDSNRLYVGYDNGTSKDLRILNQTVRIVDSLSDLPANANENDFYYIKGSSASTDSNGKSGQANILCVKTASGWVQINPDTNTTISSVEISSAATNNVATVTSKVTDSDENSKSNTMTITGAGGIAIAADASGNLTLTGDQYDIATSVTSGVAKVTLDATGRDADSNFEISNGGNVTIASTTKGFSIAAKDTTLKTSDNTFTLGDNGGSLTYTIYDTDEHAATATVSNLGVLIGSDSSKYLKLASTSGKTEATVYTKDEIDNLFNGLDGMTYKGTIGTSGDITAANLPTTGVRNGDTYVIVQKGLTSDKFTGASFESNTVTAMSNGTVIGDMLIAKGTEATSGANAGTITSGLTWTYVPAGNDSLDAVTYSTTVTAASNKIELNNANSSLIGAIEVAAGNDIGITAESTNSGKGIKYTVAHETFSAVTPAAKSTLSNGSASFSAISGITLDNGHVTAIETDTFTPVTWGISGGLSTADITNGVKTTISMDDSNEQNSSSVDFSLVSTSLAISQSSGTITANLEWGTF